MSLTRDPVAAAQLRATRRRALARKRRRWATLDAASQLADLRILLGAGATTEGQGTTDDEEASELTAILLARALAYETLQAHATRIEQETP